MGKIDPFLLSEGLSRNLLTNESKVLCVSVLMRTNELPCILACIFSHDAAVATLL